VQARHRLSGQARSLRSLLMISGMSPCRGRGSRAYSLKSVRACSFIVYIQFIRYFCIQQSSNNHRQIQHLAQNAYVSGRTFYGEVREVLQSFYYTVVLHSPCEFAQDRQLLNESRVDSQHPNRLVRIFASAFQAVMFSIDEVIRLRKR
jgi:hypothetical protein